MTGRVFVDYWLDDVPVVVGEAVDAGRITKTGGMKTIAVGRALARHATWTTGRDAYPSALTLARETLIGEKAVRRSLRNLDDLDLSIITGRGPRNVAVRTLLRPDPVRHPGCRTDDDSVRHPECRTGEADENPVRSIPAVSPVDSGSQSGTLSADNLLPPDHREGGRRDDPPASPPGSSRGAILLSDISKRTGHDLNDPDRNSPLSKTSDRLATVGWDVDSLDECGWLDDPDEKIDEPRAFFATRLARVPDTPGTTNPRRRRTTPTKTKSRTTSKTPTAPKTAADRAADKRARIVKRAQPMYDRGDWRAQTIIVAANPNAEGDDPEQNVAGIPDHAVEGVLRRIEALDVATGPIAGRGGS